MIYSFDAFTLDTETFELKIGANAIAAEPKVFRLLKYLIENRARVVSKDEIIDTVWDGLAVSDSALTYAIKEARRLTGDDGKTQAVIRTLPRLGFRFVAEVTEDNESEVAGATQEYSASPADVAAPDYKRRHMPPLVAALVFVAIVVGGLGWWQPWIERDETLDPNRLAFPLPEKPSIAVLSFDNLSGDPGQDYFSDGISETITTTLSKIPQMFVIARNSSFIYKGKPVKVQQVAEELGVRYVLEGSVQRSGDDVRITVQLIDALTDRHIWAERYDRKLNDIFDLQDEIALKVVTELQVKLTAGERARVLRRQTDNSKAYEWYLLASEHFGQFNKADNDKAQQLLQKALELDPNFHNAWLLLAAARQAEARFRWSDNLAQSISRATVAVENALAIDDTSPDAHYQSANVAAASRNFDQAISECEKALSLEPSSTVLAHCGRIWTYVDRPQEALELIREAMRREPYFPPVFFFILGNAHYHLGNFDEAIAAWEALRERTPNSVLSLGNLAHAYIAAGRIEEARAAVKENLKRAPGASVKWWNNQIILRDQEKKKRVLDNMRKAGMPEG